MPACTMCYPPGGSGAGYIYNPITNVDVGSGTLLTNHTYTYDNGVGEITLVGYIPPSNSSSFKMNGVKAS